MKQTSGIFHEAKLRWPDGVERTRIQDREKAERWKGNWDDTRVRLAKELWRMGCTSVLVTRAEGEDARLDPGVAVWFSRTKPDFSWQQGLDLYNPAPKIDEIEAAFKLRAKKVHPDSFGGGDPEAFMQVTKWRDQARAWVTGTYAHPNEYVMAIDQYKEARWNLKALQLAFFYMRQLEKVGAPSILSQTLGAFRAKLTGGSNGPVAA